MTRILFLTVGTGNIEKVEETLYTPLRKSMTTDYFDFFVFLPSTQTEHNAVHLAQEEIFKNKIFIETLPDPLMENDSDKCFKHFNDVILKYKNKYQCSVDDIVVDLTRGTKAMSSAIYSAGLRHGIYQYRYVTSMQRTELGQVVSGTEIVNSFNASMGIFLAKIDQVKSFLKSYNFSAISSLFESEKSLPEDYKKTGRYIKAVSDFYSAWHQLDYRKAFEIYPSWGESVRSQLVELGLADIIPTQDIYDWIEQLADWKNYPENALKITYPTKDECIQKAHQATKIALDLLANGRRQIDMGNFEDARVRIYRIIEMIGQIYLFERGYDTARINPNDEKIKLFNHLNNNELVEKDGVRRILYWWEEGTCSFAW